MIYICCGGVVVVHMLFAASHECTVLTLLSTIFADLFFLLHQSNSVTGLWLHASTWLTY